MRDIILVAIGVCLAACSGAGTTQPPAQTKSTSSSDAVRCSASMGPLVGPVSTLMDAGDVQECGQGGKCTYLTAPVSVGSPVCPVDDAGNIVCPQADSTPGWTCVYAAGVTNSGGDGG
jgi:hypothetical protein